MLENKFKILNFRPIVCVAISLIVGILLGGWCLTSFNMVGVIVLGVIMLALYVCYFYPEAMRFIFEHRIAFIFCALAMIFGFSAILINIANVNKRQVGSIYVEASATVKKRYDGKKMTITNLSFLYEGEVKNINGDVYLYVSDPNDAYVIGEDIVFKGSFKTYESIKEDKVNTLVFCSGVVGSVSASAGNIVKTGTISQVEAFGKLKRGVQNFFDEHFSPDVSRVAFAMMFGEKDELDSVYDDFKLSGMAHLLAVSGLHVGFMVVLLNLICKLLRLKEKYKFLFIGIFLLLYTWICGFVPSVVRAGIMTMILLLATLRHKQYDGLNSLALAGIIILLLSPMQLFSVGFQLSFLAVLGIILLSRPLNRVFSRFMWEKLAGAFAVSVSATVLTLPIIIQFYSRTSSLSVIVNLLAVPLAGIAYMLTFVFTIIVAILPFMKFILFVPEVLFGFILQLAKWVSAMDRAFVGFIPDRLFLLLAMGLSFVVSDYIFTSKKVKRIVAYAMILLFIASISTTAF
ncbi:MAG: ComEC/Rec2 family competence protein [Clostridia bacterium]|nr:ComEC/Rec2 family competence protein [Clostridia bacterium]